MNPYPDHTFKTKVVGITRGERQRSLSILDRSQHIRLVRVTDASGKAKAISVLAGEQPLGLLKKEVTEVLLPLMDEGIEFKAWLESVVQAREGHLDCFIEVFYRGPEVNVPGLRTRAKRGKGEGTPPDYRRSLGALIFFLLASALAAALGGMLTSTSVSDWYPTIAKPVWTPPNWVFGPVWTTLYAMMAVAAWLIWRTEGFNQRKTCLRFYFIQLLLNTAWSGFFFGLQSPFLGLVEIAVFWLVLVATVVAFWRLKPLAGILMVPYLAWATYAGVLNFALWRLNS